MVGQEINMERVNGKTQIDANHSKLAAPTSPTVEKVKQVKAKEAEDLMKRPERITRRKSVSQIRRDEKTEKEEIAARTGSIWTCVSRKPNQLGGYIYSFNMESSGSYLDRSAQDKKLREMYPASEINDVYGSVSLSSMHKALGYSWNRDGNVTNLNLPDREALIANWKKSQEDCPELPSLDIVSSDGIADDIEFVEAYFSHDALLSSGKEFIHDSIFHVLPLLTQIGYLRSGSFNHPKDPSYKKERARLVKALAKIYRTLMIAKKQIEEGKSNISKDLLPKLFLLLGYQTDVVSALEDTSFLSEAMLQLGGEYSVSQLWDNPSDDMERSFIKRRFGKQWLCEEEFFFSVWRKIKQIEADFDAERKKS